MDNKDAIPNEATTSTILPCLRRWDKSVVQIDVLPVPPLPYTEQFTFFECHGIQNSFVCAALIIIEPIFCIVCIYGQ